MENATVDLDFWSLIRQGAISTYPLLVCSILMLGVVIERLYTLRGAVSGTVKLTGELVPLLARGDLKAAGEAVRRFRESPARRVYNDVLEAAPKAPLPALSNIADERQFEEVQGCGAYLWILGTIGSSAPFIGLFGTVVGIMTSFQAIAGSKSTNLAVVAPGIAEALLATAIGLLAAIPAVIAYNKLSSDAGKIAVRMEGFADEFSAILSRQIDEKVAPKA